MYWSLLVSYSRIPLFFSIAFIACSQLTNGLLAPALPEMATHFAVDEHLVQRLIVVFILGLGISQLFYGPLADSYGRRRIFWLGQAIFLLGNLLTFLGFNNLDLLLAGVMIQGLGAGSNQILARCLISDSYRGKELKHGFAWLGMAASVIPVLGPVIGGIVTAYWGWHYLFVIIGIAGASLLIIAAKLLPETQVEAGPPLNMSRVFNDYLNLAADRQFIHYSSFAWIASIGLMYMISSAPFVLQHDFGLSADNFGLVMIVPAAGLALGSAFTRRFNGRWPEQQILLLASVLPFIAAFILLTQAHSLFWVVAAMSLISISVGAIYPISQSGLFAHFSGQAGTVSALSGTTQMTLTALAVGGLTSAFMPSPSAMAIIFSVMAVALILNMVIQIVKVKAPTMQ
ncbi:multidrug effflux MFS transporter [Agarivorans aestuarii]|uniref:Multidrug effflux MFS transporter n=1 Tax=Agarivorans aestuarii TaxID=1563703 RepID=A0ABU7G9G6_9ALTE|nr:multidrug effflux MFS transporter [Agarivorans aestuarii]MEE1675100.1 multidrug effflux MFS transporter [Agarivorans aestuarii]